jgi:hypothetical protein
MLNDVLAVCATFQISQWPQVKPVLRRALEMRRQIAREGALSPTEAGASELGWN